MHADLARGLLHDRHRQRDRAVPAWSKTIGAKPGIVARLGGFRPRSPRRPDCASNWSSTASANGVSGAIPSSAQIERRIAVAADRHAARLVGDLVAPAADVDRLPPTTARPSEPVPRIRMAPSAPLEGAEPGRIGVGVDGRARRRDAAAPGCSRGPSGCVTPARPKPACARARSLRRGPPRRRGAAGRQHRDEGAVAEPGIGRAAAALAEQPAGSVANAARGSSCRRHRRR